MGTAAIGGLVVFLLGRAITTQHKSYDRDSPCFGELKRDWGSPRDLLSIGGLRIRADRAPSMGLSWEYQVCWMNETGTLDHEKI